MLIDKQRTESQLRDRERDLENLVRELQLMEKEKDNINRKLN